MTSRGARRWWGFGIVVAALLPVVAQAQAPATEIFETVPLGREACTIAIAGGDLEMCAGQQITIAAQLECSPGYQRVRDPDWFLDSDFVGSGEEITLSPPPGVHVLTVTCASCEDQISVTVQGDAPCDWMPRLDAAFSNDATEDSMGVFMQVTEGSVTPGTFPYWKYLMRPFTLAAEESLTSGRFLLDLVGGNLQVFRLDGSPLPLPATFEVASLPETLLVSATALGEGRVTAAYEDPNAPPHGAGPRKVGVDEVKVRVGQFPGLAGATLAGYPFFEFAAAVNDNQPLWGALDPARHAERLGLPYRAYVVAHRAPESWAADNVLVDVSGGYETGAVTPGSITANTLALWLAGLDAGALVGKPYDVVYDFGQDGSLDPGDLIDGLSLTSAGVYVVGDLNTPGPHATGVIQYSGGSWLGQRTYYPADIATLGQLPLVVISHGNGHDYTWYDYLGHHLASYGYLVMAHQNNTQPGIETSSTTTLTNTDYLIGHQALIGGGIFSGHIDSRHITWIGHSRGGEGVVRAYDRIYDGTYDPQYFTPADVVLISSIAPTVYLGTVDTNPHEVNYHLIAGSSDGDVTGGCHLGHRQSLRIAEAARGNVQVTYVHGAGHNDFNCCGWADATGPDLIGRAEAQKVAKSYYLALVECYIQGNPAARDYLTRVYERFHPSGLAGPVVCANTYRDAVATNRFVIDDYQTNSGLATSSSGGGVSYDVANAYENRLDDGNLDFTWTAADPMNGMTRSDTGDDYQGGVVFDWTVGQDLFYEFEIVPDRRDFRSHQYLSFRACQGTRHPETTALAGPLTFTVMLRDGHGRESAINFAGYGSLTRPYLRTGLGSGTGWANEFNTVRVRLCDFETDGSGIELADIVAVRFEFGAASGSARGRIGIDDVELTRQ